MSYRASALFSRSCWFCALNTPAQITPLSEGITVEATSTGRTLSLQHRIVTACRDLIMSSFFSLELFIHKTSTFLSESVSALRNKYDSKGETLWNPSTNSTSLTVLWMMASDFSAIFEKIRPGWESKVLNKVTTENRESWGFASSSYFPTKRNPPAMKATDFPFCRSPTSIFLS